MRPSDLVGLDDPYTAWCLDEAVWSFGMACEEAMDQAEASTNKEGLKAAARVRALTAILDGGGESNPEKSEKPAAGQFRDPASLLSR